MSVCCLTAPPTVLFAHISYLATQLIYLNRRARRQEARFSDGEKKLNRREGAQKEKRREERTKINLPGANVDRGDHPVHGNRARKTSGRSVRQKAATQNSSSLATHRHVLFRSQGVQEPGHLLPLFFFFGPRGSQFSLSPAERLGEEGGGGG